jgi:hypothetical protein
MKVTVSLQIKSVRTNSPDYIAWFHREVTVALKIVSVRVTSPLNIANGVRVQRKVIVVFVKKESVRMTSQ